MKIFFIFITILVSSYSIAEQKLNYSNSLPACDDSRIKNAVFNTFKYQLLDNHIDPDSLSRGDWVFSLENIQVLGFNDFEKMQFCKGMFILQNKKNKKRIGFETIYKIDPKAVRIHNYPKRFDKTLYDYKYLEHH